MKFAIDLPKILYLALFISKFAKEAKYYNTNDLIKIAHEIKPELVRTRKDKKDYKFLDDTNLGGLRGNFSTLVTLRGYIKKNNKYTCYYGIGKTDRLFNAFKKGEIILDAEKYCAYTNNIELKKLLEKEAKNFSIREDQAHIKKFLEKNKDFKLVRDNTNFKKIAVLKSKDDKYFLRILFNTFTSDDVVEFNMLDYLKGPKIKQFNIHPLFAIPSYDNYWEEFYVIDSKEILTKTPLFMCFDKKAKKFYDNKGNVYPYLTLDESLEKISGQNGNIEERLAYDWKTVRTQIADDSIVQKSETEQEEFLVFLKNFLDWKRTFFIYDKKVVDYEVSSSGGVDVTLKFSGGTTQKLELEHKWKNYILHNHYKDPVWKDAWLYADEKWDFDNIKKIFSPYLTEYGDNIPRVFLCANDTTKEKEAYEVDWKNLTYSKIDIKD